MENETSGQRVGHARVSRGDHQRIDGQLLALEKAGVTKVFQDDGVSGALASRPGLDAALEYLRPSDTLVVLSLSRLGRSTKQLLQLVDDLGTRDVRIASLTEGIDTATPGGRLMVTVLAALAQMERELIIERTQAGLAASRARGVVPGRKPVPPAKRSALRRLVDAGTPVPEAARSLGIGTSTAYRLLQKEHGVQS